MARVCLVGNEDIHLQYELLSRETARDALAAYDLREPFENSVAVETVSLGAAVSLLNDLNWYLIRFVEDAIVYEPSVSDDEWLSRGLAAAIRDDQIKPEDSDRFLKIYGLEYSESATQPDSPDSEKEDDEAAEPGDDGNEKNPPTDTDEETAPGYDEAAEPPRLVEPMLVTRTGDSVPEYDLQPVAETLTVRVTAEEFGA